MTSVVEEEPAVVVEVAKFVLRCEQCCNGRTQIRPGGTGCFDTVPCSRCCPAAYRTAMAASRPESARRDK